MAALVVAHALLLAPVTLYVTNLEEFHSSLGEVAQYWVLPAVCVLLVLILPPFLLGSNLAKRLAGLFAALGIVVFLQGTLLVWNYGPLDGRPIDWQADAWRGLVDSVLWLGLPLLAMLFHERIYRRLIHAALLVFAINLVSTGTVAFLALADRRAGDNDGARGDLAEALQFGANGNVFHVVIDGFQADVFQDLINHPDIGASYRNALDGFEYFSETMSVFPYTEFSIPSYLSAQVYDNRRPKLAFIDQAINGKSILTAAAERGYEVDVLVGSPYLTRRFSSPQFRNVFDIESLAVERAQREGVKLIDLGLFRVAPHFIKPFIYNEQRWLLTSVLGDMDVPSVRYFTHTRFLYRITEALQPTRSAPVYKYLHVHTTHRPMVVTPDCNYAGVVLPDTRVTLTIQSKCALDTIVRMFERLKETGLYDDALIIMQADHGGWVPNHRQGPPIKLTTGAVVLPVIASLSSPLLAIKPPGAKGPLRENQSLVTLADLPDTISDILGWGERYGFRALSTLTPGEERERRFYFYDWRPDEWEQAFAGPVYEFLIKGSHYDVKWEPTVVLPPGN